MYLNRCYIMRVINKSLLLLICSMAKKTTESKPKELGMLAERLKELRKKKGFTNYEHFAWTNGISRAQYGRYEQGEDLRFTTLIKIVKAHGMTIAEFFSEGFN